MSRTQTNPGKQTAQSTAQSVGRQPGVIPNFHHLGSHSPLALETYIHLYLEGAAKSGLEGSGGGRGRA
jgi:hypothetical protein